MFNISKIIRISYWIQLDSSRRQEMILGKSRFGGVTYLPVGNFVLNAFNNCSGGTGRAGNCNFSKSCLGSGAGVEKTPITMLREK